jgi:flagella basal body P-ring formation protein FlgA
MKFPAVFCRVLLVALCLPAAAAQAPADPLRRAVEDYLRAQTRGFPGKVSFSIAPLDARARLAPCDVFEPFQPTGAAPWGRTTVGVRCLGPASWTAYVQVRIRVLAAYLVAARPMAAGHVIGQGDFITREGDLGALPAAILMDGAQALGRTIRIGIAAGQPLRADQMTAPWAVRRGQTVKTVSRGEGFSASSEGRALNNAQEGDIVQVRTQSGQTVSGVARPGGIVEMNY